MKVLAYALSVFFLDTLLFAASPDPNFGRIPLSFEENRGQFQNDVSFVSRGAGYLFRFKPQQFELDFQTNIGSDRIITTLVDSSPVASITAAEPAGRVNYLIGSDSRKWITNVPTYRRICYPSVYQGIDLLYHGNERNLEYTFVVRPHSDPNQIVLRLDGVQTATVLRSGSLKLQLARQYHLETTACLSTSGQQTRTDRGTLRAYQ